MDRETVKQGLRAYSLIDGIISSKEQIALEFGNDEVGKLHHREIESLRTAKRQMINALNTLNDIQMDVVWRKYIRGEYWVRVGMRHHYSERQIIRIGEAGLDALAEIMEEYPEAADFCKKCC